MIRLFFIKIIFFFSQLQINNIGVYQSYNATITSYNGTINYGNNYIIKSSYYIINKTMNINFLYSCFNNTNAISGNGIYLFSIPTNYTINKSSYNYDMFINTITDPINSFINQSICGSGVVYDCNSNKTYTISVCPVNNKNNVVCLYINELNQYISSNNCPINNIKITYKFNATLYIL